MSLPALRRLGWLRPSTLLAFLHRSEPTRNLEFRIDKSLGRLAVIR